MQLMKKTDRQMKERLKFGLSQPDELRHDYLNPTTAKEWKNIYRWLHR